MTRKLFTIGILMLALLSASFSSEGDQKGIQTDAKNPAPTNLKKVVHMISFSDTVQAPALLPDSDHTIADLFENRSAASHEVSLNPRAVAFVDDYMDKHGKDLLKMKEWAKPYFNLMDAIFAQYGLPRQLKYLAVIESELKPTAKSWAGAVGPWQLMPETARLFGLKVTRTVDERTDYRKSTRAAARYLRELYNEFGDWLLTIAAYNGGPASVYYAIRKSGSRNFWDLQYYLPAETRNHVKKFIATHYVFEGQGGITTLTRAEVEDHIESGASWLLNRQLTPEEAEQARTVTVSGKYVSEIIAKNVLMDVDDFNRYNPDFDRVMASGEAGYELKLPPDKMNLFITNKYRILSESVQFLLNTATAASTTPSASGQALGK